jgi:hypothetical protein
MNTVEKQKLYKKILKIREAAPRNFGPHGYLDAHNPKLLVKLQEKFKVAVIKAEHLYQYLNPSARSTCVTCKGPVGFARLDLGWKEYCSTSCVQNSPVIRAKKEATNLARRGCKWPTQSTKVRKKVEATNLKKLGVRRPAQSAKVQAKMRNTTQER